MKDYRPDTSVLSGNLTSTPTVKAKGVTRSESQAEVDP